MTTTPNLAIASPADLRRAMRTSFEVSDQQWAAISAPLEPAVVIAGAGSGKTALMAARVVYLVANRIVEPGQVLGLTFTTKAASELGTRIREALGVAGFGPGQPDPDDPALPPPAWEQEDAEELLEPTVATYNGYASSLLAEHGLRIGHEPDTRVMADASRFQLAARAIARHRGQVELLSDHPDTVVNYILGLEGAMSEHLVDVDDVRAFQAREMPRVQQVIETARAKADPRRVLNAMQRREELLGLVSTYRRLKADLGLMDFSDQIALAARLADEHPEVGMQEREKFRIVLLDEYQDTSVAQALMLKKLFGGGHAVTAVGDPNQAIYGWRGASVANILGFGKDFTRADGSPDVPIHPLTVNRRSDRRILETANQLAAPLLEKFPQVRALDPDERAGQGVVRTSVHPTYAAELEWLAEQVRATHDAMEEPAWHEIGVLTRDNKHAADVFDALSSREIPVEIVGLNGLLRLPEVAEVVATLTLLNDLTANAALLTLLTGPRWAIGPRDLALLGKRAHELARAGTTGTTGQPLADQLAEAVEGADPTEVTSLCDALDDPGEAAYSAAALERFALLRGELRMLRSHVGEPLLDLVRRIIDTTGIDIELASSISPAAAARRDNLDLFVKAVADFQAIDGEVSLTALLAYLETEDEMGTGLDVATPTEADSVKLLTVHRAKGLEWDAVFVVGVGEEKFPTTRSRTQWIYGPGVLPNPLRGDRHSLAQLSGYEKDQLAAMVADAKALEQEEELRLGYVAFTRARHMLSVSSYVWNDQRQKPIGPSPYQAVVRECLRTWGEEPESWLVRPGPDEVNPLLAQVRQAPWPVTEHTAEALRRLEAAEFVASVDPDAADDLDLVEASIAEEWDTELDRLLAEARRDRATEIEVPLPSSLSATTLARIQHDPDELARDLARPMPRQPSPSARFGTRFHAWVEARFGQQSLIEADELPGRADLGIDDESDLKELTETFAAGPFGHRIPHATEAPFALVLAGQVVRGRIDAIYVEDDGTHLVIDWKTNRRADADPLQLAIYRLAWAELQGLPLDQVRAAFHYVRTGLTDDRSDELPDREELEDLLR
ncbi:ATP-dependent DNA helicase [Nocardioides sp. AE5]|uniref:ATP-dependent DNA helicase n=1 Tax=Nocardioides sp. AE5 TaxID=2962573 RepID=UPI002881A788|nr:ATP-dependent DNA helicase [Nocardioides sp. AE5]MDT0203950.1 ATP-dependent DNA helicase [Nocardioides sp. AE5]